MYDRCVTTCLVNYPGSWIYLGVLAPASTLKTPGQRVPFGGGRGNKNICTNFDKRFPNLPFADPNGGVRRPVGTGTRTKPVGRLRTAVWGTAAFGGGYFLGALGTCSVQCY